MATDTVFVQGKCTWARTQRPDEWGNWSIQIHMDNKSLEIINKLIEQGLKNRLKKDNVKKKRMKSN